VDILRNQRAQREQIENSRETVPVCALLILIHMDTIATYSGNIGQLSYWYCGEYDLAVCYSIFLPASPGAASEEHGGIHLSAHSHG
jgi:hypothetical protein